MKFERTNILFFCLFAFASNATFANEEIIKRKYYTLSYNEDHEVANWVSYELKRNHLVNCVNRSNNFRSDPMVSTGSAQVIDYRHSGFDRGHLVPAGDRKFSREAMSDTFYMSNVTPQSAPFNRGRWAQLETLVRAWAFNYQKLWIVTGPVLEKGLQVIGKVNDVSVPLTYFKVILRKTGNKYEGIGFLMETSIPFRDLKAYVKTINQIEELTGTDYFQFLDEETAEKVEGQVNLKDWDFNAKFEYQPCPTSAIQ